MQGTLREVTGALTIGVAYTYSHSMDDSSDRSSANFTNSLDIRSNRGSSDFDQRHMLNVNYIYALPLIRWLDGIADLLHDEASTCGDCGTAAACRKRQGIASAHLLCDHFDAGVKQAARQPASTAPRVRLLAPLAGGGTR